MKRISYAFSVIGLTLLVSLLATLFVVYWEMRFEPKPLAPVINQVSLPSKPGEVGQYLVRDTVTGVTRWVWPNCDPVTLKGFPSGGRCVTWEGNKIFVNCYSRTLQGFLMWKEKDKSCQRQ